MKTYFLYFALLSVVTLSSGCSSNEEKKESIVDSLKRINELSNKAKYTTVKVNDAYQIKVVDELKTMPGLNQDASLSYANIYKEKYIIVIDEAKDEFIAMYTEMKEFDDQKSPIENYAEVQLKFMREQGNITQESELVDKKVHGMSARHKQLDAKVEGVDKSISYWLTYVEGEDRLYTIMAWTLSDRKSEFDAEAKRMLSSLKEL